MGLEFWQVACRADDLFDTNDAAVIHANCTFNQLQVTVIGSRFLLFAPAGPNVSYSCGTSHATFPARLEPVVLRNRDQS